MSRTASLLVLLIVLAAAGAAWSALDGINIDSKQATTMAEATASEVANPEGPATRPSTEEISGARPDATPPPGALVGRVVDRGGIGLAAARVTVTLNVPPGRRTFALVARFEKTLTADDDGRFRLDVPGGGVYRAIAEAEGFGPGFVDGLNPGQDTEILLLPPATLEGTCRDVDGGRPIEGATVVVTPADGTPVRRATTKQDGVFRFDDLAGGRAVVTADHPSFAEPAPLDVDLESGGRRAATLEFDPGKQLKGEVVSAEERLPVEGATVSVGKKQATTEKNGTFVLKGLSTNRHTVQVSAPGFLPDSRVVTLQGTRREGNVSVALRRGATLRGRVITESGEPVANAELRIFNTWGDQSSWWEDWETRHLKVKSAGDGTFVFAGIPPDEHAQRGVRARHPDWPERFESIPKIKTVDDVETVTVTLRAGAKIEGVVVDPEGAGVVGARVELTSESTWEDGDGDGARAKAERTRVTGSRDEGAFMFGGLAPGRYGIRVDVRGYPTGWKNEITVDPQGRTQPVRIQLENGRTLLGRVVADADSTPVPEARVHVWGKSGSANGVSDKTGAFALDSVGRGPYEVRVTALGYADLRLENQNPGGEGFLLRMKRLARVTGRVVDKKTDKPVTQFTVKGTTEDPRRAGQRRNVLWIGCTSKDGTFAVTMPPGKVAIVVEASGYAEAPEQSLTLEAGVDPPALEFAMSKGGSIEGTVRDARGDALQGVSIFIGKDDEAAMPTSSDTESDGYYFMADLAPGIYKVAAQRWGLPLEIVRGVVVGTERPTRVDIQFPPSSTLILRVGTDKARPEANAGAGTPETSETPAARAPESTEEALAKMRASVHPSVRIEGLENQPLTFEWKWNGSTHENLPSSWDNLWLERGSDGFSGRATHLQPGRYRLTIRAPMHETITQIVNIGFGSTQAFRFDLRARSGARLDPNRRGRIIYPDGSSEMLYDRRSRWGNWGNDGE